LLEIARQQFAGISATTGGESLGEILFQIPEDNHSAGGCRRRLLRR
jgi:hypothetical protein